jgi:Patched family
LIGLGVDDMYIILLALKKEKSYTEEGFVRGMNEVVVPVSMTSLVNAAMFAIMNISDVPAVYLTARVALIAVCFLYLSMIFSFSAYCYLDMRRQSARRHDVLFWIEVEETNEDNRGNKCVGTWLSSALFDKCFHPLLLKESSHRFLSHALIWVVAAVLLGLAIWGITEREVGLGLEDFFPSDNQANKWATTRTETLGSWSIGMHWGALEYSNPDTQMKMIKQFEGVVAHSNVAEIDTKQLWMADFLIWTSRHCDDNVANGNGYCGRDQFFAGDNTTCSGTWKPNDFGLRLKIFDEGKGECKPYEGGICRPITEMHPYDLQDLGVDPTNSSSHADKEWCPVFEGWSDDKVAFCLKQWRFLTGGDGGLILEDQHGTPTTCSGEYFNDENVSVPILYSSGPLMFSFSK